MGKRIPALSQNCYFLSRDCSLEWYISKQKDQVFKGTTFCACTINIIGEKPCIRASEQALALWLCQSRSSSPLHARLHSMLNPKSLCCALVHLLLQAGGETEMHSDSEFAEAWRITEPGATASTALFSTEDAKGEAGSVPGVLLRLGLAHASSHASLLVGGEVAELTEECFRGKSVYSAFALQTPTCFQSQLSPMSSLPTFLLSFLT